MDCEKIVPMYDLSVIIPVYNAGRYLNETLRAVVMQTIFDKIELIIVNDGSDDNSMDICEKYADAYSNIVVIDQKNAGVSAARNAGIKAATGAYITFLDADDYVETNLYERMLKLTQKHSADVAIVNFLKVHPDGEAKQYRNAEDVRQWTDPKAIMQAFFSGVIGNQVVDKIFSRDVIAEIQFPIGYKIGEDMFFVYRAIRNARKIIYDTEICGYHYIVRQDSAMTGQFTEKFFDPVKLSEMMCDDYVDDKEVFAYAKAHLIHEICKSLEYTYRHGAENTYSLNVANMRKTLNGYSITYAKKHLIRRQFYGFVLMRISPRLYLLIHKIMQIG